MTLKNLKKLRDLNNRLNRWETYFQKEILDSRPVIVQIPTGTKCNLKCVFCTDREGKASENYYDLSFEDFISLSEPIFLSSMLQLYGWGEPFINPEYEKMFDYVVDNFEGIKFYISTNGSLLNDTWINKLAKYNNSIINISLNASTAATYGSIMKRDKFEQVMRNIKKLDEARRKVEGCMTKIFLSFVNTDKNIDELPEFVEIASEINAGVIIQDMNIIEQKHANLMVHPDKARYVLNLAQKKALEKKVQFCSFSSLPRDHLNNPDLASNSGPIPDDIPLLPPPPGQCYEPWQRILMSADGTVSPCCNSQMNLGNLHEKTFQEIWNGDMYIYLRQTVNTPNPPGDCLKCPVKMSYLLS